MDDLEGGSRAGVVVGRGTMGSMLNLGSWKRRKSSGVGGGSSEFRSPSRGRHPKDSAASAKAFRRTQSEAARAQAFTLPHPHHSSQPFPPSHPHHAHHHPPLHQQPPPIHHQSQPPPQAHPQFHSATLGRPAPLHATQSLNYNTATLPNPRHHHNGYLGRAAPNFAQSGYYYSGRSQPERSGGKANGHAAHHRGGPPPLPSGPHLQQPHPQRGERSKMGRDEVETPSYWVEHLATFAVGQQYGLNSAADGIRKLKQMERSSAIWAQPMVLRLRPAQVSVEDENGELVESFPMALVQDPTAHLSNNPDDTYNNLLLFVVGEDRSARGGNPTEMHIFQCNRVSANDVVADISAFISRDYKRVRPGRRETGFTPGPDLGLGNGFASPFASSPSPGQGGPISYTRTESREVRPSSSGARSKAITAAAPLRDDASASSDSSEYFERDVNTLNRCFDDIERFVSRIQSAALAQREMEAAAARKHKAGRSNHKDPGILALRAQLPGELEFLDVLQKFKLSFNLLAKLRNHIHEPNAPELLHFLFTPLTVILDACHWGLGRNIAPQVLSPLLTREAIDLLRNCLTSKESDVWMALGDAWRTAPEDWPSALPPPYRPVFADGYMPYGPPGQVAEPVPPPVPAAPHRSSSNLAAARSTDGLNLDLDRISLEKDKLEFEREKVIEEKRRIAERERKVWEEERRLEEERMAVAAARERLNEDQRSIVSSQPPGGASHLLMDTSAQSSPSLARGPPPVTSTPNGPNSGPPISGESPRQRAFLEDLRAAGAKISAVTYDRVGQNSKELTVSKGEYLEVLSDRKKWWECRNVLGRMGYVPHTIMSVVSEGGRVPPSSSSSSGHHVSFPASPLPVPVSPLMVLQQPLFVQAGTSGGMGNGGLGNGGTMGNGGGSEYNGAGNGMSNGGDPGLSPGSRPGALTNGNAHYRSHNVLYDSEDQPPSPPHSKHHGLRSTGPPPAPPPPAPGPPPDLTRTQPRPAARAPAPRSSLAPSDQPVRAQSSSDLLRDELERTIGRGQNREELLVKKRPTSAHIVIAETSTPDEVALWLHQKGFNSRTAETLAGQSGRSLFAYSKNQMIDFCGRDEGSRLASLILVQKKLTGYETKSGAELASILKLRKSAAEGPASDTREAPPRHPNGPLQGLFQPSPL